VIYDAYERDFITLAPLMDTHARLRAYQLDDDLCWLLPAAILPGVTSAYGLPVLRPGVDEPMLAHRARRP